jgi:hypothetical protein
MSAVAEESTVIACLKMILWLAESMGSWAAAIPADNNNEAEKDAKIPGFISCSRNGVEKVREIYHGITRLALEFQKFNRASPPRFLTGTTGIA